MNRLMNIFSKSAPEAPATELSVEPLEQRQMLSAVEIFAAGQTGQEILELQLFDASAQNFKTVQSWQVGGDVDSRDFEVFQFNTDQDIDIRDIRVQFVNDFVSEDGSFDRNLAVDGLVLDGIVYETEDPRTFFTAWANNRGGVGAGRFSTELLNVDGGIRYSPASGTPVEAPAPVLEPNKIFINASGTTGEEILLLRVDGQVVNSFNVTQDLATYEFMFDEFVSIDRISIAFENDLFDPANDIDRNLVVPDLTLLYSDGTSDTFQTKSDRVFSTGTWLAEDGVADGFGRDFTLHANGFFQYEASNA